MLESSHLSSPDAKWEAVLEHVDNGMGFGLGAIFDEVHLHQIGEKGYGHGDRDPSVVFYIESTNLDGDRPVVEWVDAHHLLVKYPNINKPGRTITSFQDVVIRYQTFALKTMESSSK